MPGQLRVIAAALNVVVGRVAGDAVVEGVLARPAGRGSRRPTLQPPLLAENWVNAGLAAVRHDRARRSPGRRRRRAGARRRTPP